MLDKLYGMVEYFKDHELVFWYNGPVSQVLVVEIGDIIKKSIDTSSDKKVITRIFGILVEQMQNIIKYSVQKTPRMDKVNRFFMSSGLIAVGIENEFYSVVSGNPVKNKDIKRISERLDRIIAMDREGLKDYYKTMRRQEPDEQSLGAGLGFIEMAKKASMPLEYRFTAIDENHSFFSMKALVKMEP
ncbi:MAG: SiaB family protein kinase [Proteobacteria bacterium]|nr:SiaB family protein kinase [Pseudomonadota bacterium]